MRILRILLPVLLFLCCHAKMKNPYTVLGIKRTSSAADVKKAFRKLSLQNHPDKNGGNDDLFIEVARAYEILSDEKTRRQYDAGEYDVDHSYASSQPSHPPPTYHRNQNFEQENEEMLKSKGNLLYDLLVLSSFLVFSALGFFFVLANRKKCVKVWKRFSTGWQVSKALNNREDVKKEEGTEETKRQRRSRAKDKVAGPLSSTNQGMASEIAERQQQKASHSGAKEPKGVIGGSGEWEEEELRMLDKALAKFPVGTAKRWDQVTAYVRTRTMEEVTVMVKERQGMSAARLKASEDFKAGQKKRAEVTSSLDLRGTCHVVDASKPPPVGKIEWSQEQEKSLVRALKEVPKDDPERWERVSALVGGKTKLQCRKRFQELKEMHRKKQEGGRLKAEVVSHT